MRRLYLVLPVYTEVYGGSLHWAWIGQFGVFQWLDESLFWLQLPCLDVAGVSFTKWEPVEGIDFLSALVEAARVLEGFNLNGCDIRTSQFGSGDMKTRPAAECVFWSKLSWCSHVYLCILHCTLHTHTRIHAQIHCQRGRCAICTILQKMTAIIHLCQVAALYHGYIPSLKGCCDYSKIRCKCTSVFVYTPVLHAWIFLCGFIVN